MGLSSLRRRMIANLVVAALAVLLLLDSRPLPPQRGEAASGSAKAGAP
ncbi:MAG TPA: hypothetical protein PLC02_02655 [Pseudomonadota bacterium]|nr:hypothetical protein [Pseudomonadota bacterium]